MPRRGRRAEATRGRALANRYGEPRRTASGGRCTGECGSCGVSAYRWWMRCTAAHASGSVPTMTRKYVSSTVANRGWTRKAWWARQRWAYSSVTTAVRTAEQIPMTTPTGTPGNLAPAPPGGGSPLAASSAGRGQDRAAGDAAVARRGGELCRRAGRAGDPHLRLDVQGDGGARTGKGQGEEVDGLHEPVVLGDGARERHGGAGLQDRPADVSRAAHRGRRPGREVDMAQDDQV